VAERMLLPSLLSALPAAGRAGTFLEIGSVQVASLTVGVERCYNWTGLLVVGGEVERARAVAAGRRATIVVAPGGICPSGPGGTALLSKTPWASHAHNGSSTPHSGDAHMIHGPSGVGVSVAPTTARGDASCMSMLDVLRVGGLADVGVTYLVASQKTLEAYFDPPVYIAPTEAGGHGPGKLEWKDPTPSAAMSRELAVIAARWHGPPAWERCAGCRISKQTRLSHERRLHLQVPATRSGATTTMIEFRAYTLPQLCYRVVFGRGIVTCFGAASRGVCGLPSERGCSWAETLWTSAD
jgi:hypothetical protein